MTLRVVARTRLLLVFGCVFFAVFKPSGVPPPGAESGYLPCMQQSVPPERYLDDWGDHLFNHTFTRLTQRLRLGALLHPATLRGQLHAIQKYCCPSGLVQQLRNISTVSCKGDGNCGWHSLLNGNCRFLGQRTSYEHPIGDIRRLKAKVADNIVHHVTAGRALSVADLQRQCAVPGVSPPLRLFMGQRARTMGFELSDSIDRLKRFSDFEVLLQHNFLADRRYLSLGVLSVGIIIDLPLVFRPKLFTFPNNMSLESEQHLACGSTTEVFPPPRIRLYNTTTHDTQVYWQDTNLAKHRTPGTYCCSETVFQKYWNL